MKEIESEEFLNLIKGLFKEETRLFIKTDTDFRTLKEWSSLQMMIVVSEIDREYDVILSGEDMANAPTIRKLLNIVNRKIA